jgi:hypothetical protein
MRMIMEKIRERMLTIAKRIHGEIHPCGMHKTFKESFNKFGDSEELIFWFNCRKDSTHAIRERDLEKLEARYDK